MGWTYAQRKASDPDFVARVRDYGRKRRQDPEVLKRMNLTAKRSYWKRRLQIIDMLGGKCVGIGCTVTDPRILQINHKNGDGAMDKSGYPLYQSILSGKR